MAGVEPKGQDTWRQVAAVVDGKNVPVGPGALLTVGADGYTVTVNGKVYQRGTTTTDYQQVPHASDVAVTEGPHAGQTLPQIFTVEGDVLIACNAPPGAARPTAFTSPPGSGHTLSVWLRTPGAPPPAPLTLRTILILYAFLMAANVVGFGGQELGASLGPWVGLLAGGLAGVLVVTAVGLLLGWGWRSALNTGVTVSVAANTFEGLRPVLAPTLGAVGAVFVSASTAIVAGGFVAAVMTRLLKQPGWR
jgi:uncharacterized protein (TIGR03067 family)